MGHINKLSISAADITTNPTGVPEDASFAVTASAQAVVAGTSPVGTLQLQACDDIKDGVPTNWSNITGASIAISGNGVYLIPKLDICYQWVRPVFTYTSGTGTITVRLNTIGIYG